MFIIGCRLQLFMYGAVIVSGRVRRITAKNNKLDGIISVCNDAVSC